MESPTLLSDASGSQRLLATLQRLLSIQSPELRPSLTQASTLVAEALSADKVDVFLYEAASDSLVAMGTSDTPMGYRQHEAGLNRQAIANNGPSVRTFLTGEPYLSGAADQDPDQIRGNVHRLEIRSEMDVVLEIGGERRGIVHVACRAADSFTVRDLDFLIAVAGWIGMVTHRAELFEEATRDAERRGRERAAEELRRITRREREVAILIAEGLTNAAIADRLVLTEGTVANHIEHILRRLGLKSRTQVAVWAVQCGLFGQGLDGNE